MYRDAYRMFAMHRDKSDNPTIDFLGFKDTIQFTLGAPISLQQCRAVFDLVDMDGDGQLSVHELVTFFSADETSGHGTGQHKGARAHVVAHQHLHKRGSVVLRKTVFHDEHGNMILEDEQNSLKNKGSNTQTNANANVNSKSTSSNSATPTTTTRARARAKAVAAASTLLTRGRHSGKTFAQVRRQHPKYAKWALEIKNPRGELMGFVEYLHDCAAANQKPSAVQQMNAILEERKEGRRKETEAGQHQHQHAHRQQHQQSHSQPHPNRPNSENSHSRSHSHNNNTSRSIRQPIAVVFGNRLPNSLVHAIGPRGRRRGARAPALNAALR